MSGHSKWASIKHKKGAADAKRGKVFTMHAKLITIAAAGGGDPDMNPALRGAIDRAKADNVPNLNIDRAIKKGTGEDKDAANYEEITYEAMGPGGSAFMIDIITDNKNRSLTNVKTAVNKNGGTFGSSVAWKFDKKAYLLVDSAGKDPEEAELELIDCGADDLVDAGEGKFELYADAGKCFEIKKAAEAAGFKVEKDELVWKGKDELKVDDAELAKKIVRLMEAIDEDEDVSQVSSDVDFDESVLASLG
jgi:YebC/PmpR family DNA-binding regulatory protein